MLILLTWCSEPILVLFLDYRTHKANLLRFDSRFFKVFYVFTRDDVVSQRLKFGSAFLSSPWESKIALLFGRGPNRVMETACFDANVQ